MWKNLVHDKILTSPILPAPAVHSCFHLLKVYKAIEIFIKTFTGIAVFYSKAVRIELESRRSQLTTF